jgi:hypothetical protein
MKDCRIRVGVGVMLMSCAVLTGTAGAADETRPAVSQVNISCQLMEMPSATVKQLFGSNGAAPGGDVGDDLLQRILKEPGVDLLSAPCITARAGESAQIKVCQDRSFATSFKVVQTNGAWEPVIKNIELGITVTVVANPYPHDPERIRGAAEVSISELVGVSEQKVTPPGQKNTLTLQSPAVQTRALTTMFDVRSGKTTILGGMDKMDGNTAKSTVVLLKVVTLSSAPELVRKLKAMSVDLELRDAALNDVVAFLVDRSRLMDPEKKGVNIIVQSKPDNKPTPLTLSVRNLSIYDALGFVARACGASIEYDPNAVILRLP